MKRLISIVVLADTDEAHTRIQAQLNGDYALTRVMPTMCPSEPTVTPASCDHIDLVILDLDSAGFHCAQLWLELRARCGRARLVGLVTPPIEPGVLQHALHAGTVSLLSKTNSRRRLAEALRLAQQGAWLLDPPMHELVYRFLRCPAETSFQLTPRQYEIVVCMARGMTDRQIAYALRIHTRTVNNHVARIMDTLEVHSRTAATAKALKLGLIELE